MDMHIYTLCPSLLQSFTTFSWVVSEELHWQTVSVVSFIFVKFQKGRNSKKKNWNIISCGYAHLHIMSFITTKFHEILLSGFRGVALTRKTGLMDGSKTLYSPQIVAWGINIIWNWIATKFFFFSVIPSFEYLSKNVLCQASQVVYVVLKNNENFENQRKKITLDRSQTDKCQSEKLK